MRYFIFMTNGGHTWDDAGDEIDNCQQISDPIEVEDDCGALEAYNKMLVDRKWYGAFDTCYSLELKSLETSSFDLINDEDEEDENTL